MFVGSSCHNLKRAKLSEAEKRTIFVWGEGSTKFSGAFRFFSRKKASNKKIKGYRDPGY
jgi:hypothetical protein